MHRRSLTLTLDPGLLTAEGQRRLLALNGKTYSSEQMFDRPWQPLQPAVRFEAFVNQGQGLTIHVRDASETDRTRLHTIQSLAFGALDVAFKGRAADLP